MIRRIEVVNWRSYRRLELDLGPGATFIVAPNGVGKTSIVEAARFAIFGRLPTRPGFRRLGADGPTEVIATIELDTGPDLVITRTVPMGRNAKPSVSAALGNETLDADGVDRLLADRFGGPVEFLDRLSMVQSSDIIVARETLDLRSHLGELLGISGIDSALDDTSQLLRTANAGVGQQREAVTVSAEEVVRLAAIADDAAARLAVAEKVVSDANATLEEARVAIREADRHSVLVSRAGERDAELRAIRLDAAALLGGDLPGDDLDAALAEVESASLAAIDEQRRRRSELQGRIDAVLAALAELSAASGSCPVCRRPLAEADVADARAGHEADVASWRAELDELDTSRDEDIAARASQLRRRMARLGPAVEIPADLADPKAASRAESAAIAAVQEAMTAAATLRAEATAAKRTHDDAVHAASALTELVAAFERVATLEAVEQALSRVRTVLLDEGIEPLAEAIEDQWTRLFENRRGLVLAGDGALTRSVGDDALEFGGFSDGERMAAQLLVRIVVLTATTRLPFLWIDEPLEHLDPDSRRALALMLARAPGEGGSLNQVVMTTYEEPLVRRLSAVVPNTQMYFVRPSA